jgi:hypothetical protein
LVLRRSVQSASRSLLALYGVSEGAVVAEEAGIVVVVVVAAEEAGIVVVVVVAAEGALMAAAFMGEADGLGAAAARDISGVARAGGVGAIQSFSIPVGSTLRTTAA